MTTSRTIRPRLSSGLSPWFNLAVLPALAFGIVVLMYPGPVYAWNNEPTAPPPTQDTGGQPNGDDDGDDNDDCPGSGGAGDENNNEDDDNGNNDDDCPPKDDGTPGNGSSGDDGGEGGEGGGGCPSPETSSPSPVNYFNGSLTLIEQDLPTVAGSWLGHTRSFKNRLSADYDGPNGFNWQLKQWPSLADPNGDQSVLVLISSGQQLYFDQVSGGYEVRHGNPNQVTLIHDATNDVYILRQIGNATAVEYVFGDFTQTSTPQGLFKKRVDSAGHVAEAVSYFDNMIAEIQQMVTSDGTTVIYSLLYDYYISGENTDRLRYVTLRKQVNVDPWEPLRRVEYAYYGSSESYGSLNDLKTATVQIPNGSGWSDTTVTYYRYYEGAYSAGSNPGLPHLLKYKLGAEGYRRMKADALDPFTATAANLADYADFYFEYDNQGKVTKEVTAADCGGCGVNGTTGDTFVRSQNPNYPTNPADPYNTWKWKIIYGMPDGDRQIIYTNHVGYVMLKVFEDVETGRKWRTFYEFNDRGQVVLRAFPSAITGHSESALDLLNDQSGNYQYLADNSGLIRVFSYYASTGSGVDETTPGGVEGYLRYKRIKEGELDSAITLREYTYFAHAVDLDTDGTPDVTTYPLAQKIKYPDAASPTQTITTAYSYQWESGTTRIQSKTVTLPAVPTAQNGSGAAATVQRVFDDNGYIAWVMNERGFITRFKKDASSGRLLQTIKDVDTSLTSDEPTGWSTPSSGGLHLVTDYEYDGLGRLTQVLGPDHTIDANGEATNGDHTARTAAWFVYIENAPTTLDETRVGRGYKDLTAGAEVLVDPVTLLKQGKKGRRTYQRIESARSSGSGELSASDTFDRADWTAWTVNQYSNDGLLTSASVYHDIPSSGMGSDGANYDTTGYTYDSETNELIRIESPGGTIVRLAHDAHERVIATWVGTDDTGFDPATGGGNMVKIAESEYDQGQDGGDGNLTQVTRFVNDTTTRVTTFAYDFRNRRISVDGEIDLFQKLGYDNLNRLVKTERYDTTDSGNLIARIETKFDDRNRIYQRISYAVNPSTGSVGNSLVSSIWYDAAGNVVKTIAAGDGESFTKMSYDGLGRQTAAYIGFDADESGYSTAVDVAGDTVVEQSETSYDDAGNAVQVTSYQRHHDDTTSTGALTSSTARITYTASWFDGIGRRIASAAYGTNGGQSFTRPHVIPTRSDTVLVASTEYDGAGNVFKTTDPKGVETRKSYDDKARLIKAVENYIDGDPNTGGSDQDRTTTYAYTADGMTKTITAVNPATGDQVTHYAYGTTLSDSDVASSALLRAIIYPDSDDPANLSGDGTDGMYDRVERAYNRLGQITHRQDQRETVRAFDYDALGRLIHDRVMSLGRPGENVDGTVRRISRTYEVRGMLESIASYDNASAGQGAVLNEVELAYNDFGQLVTEYQAHGGAVSTSTTPNVAYGYASGTTNHVRQTSLTYPDGRVIDYAYGTAGGIDDLLNRVGAIEDGTTTLASYEYLGLARVVRLNYEQPQVRLDLWGGTSGAYAGLDRFGRIIDRRWIDYGASADADRFRYGYDRASNRLWRENVLATEQDELYAYDGLHRLAGMDRGDLNPAKDAVTTLAFAQQWGLDPLGNWSDFYEDANGDSTWDLDQAREHNQANEIADTSGDSDAINETAGTSWADPVHDAAGNMATLPKPKAPADAFSATYDAWNRLVKMADEATAAMVAKYTYDGRGRRIVKSIDTNSDGVLDQTRHAYYTNRWQLIEERVGTSTNAERQFVWTVGYIDELVSRDRDTNGDGSLDERLYVLQDANFDVTTVVSAAGTVLERYLYTPYGQRTVLDSNFGADTDNQSDYDFHFGCRGLMHDPATGLIYTRYRMLHPILGRFLQRDPLGYVDGMSLYSAYFITWGGLDPYGLGYLELFQEGLQAASDWLYTGEILPTKDQSKAAKEAAGKWLCKNSPVRGGYGKVRGPLPGTSGVFGVSGGGKWTINGGGGLSGGMSVIGGPGRVGGYGGANQQGPYGGLSGGVTGGGGNFRARSNTQGGPSIQLGVNVGPIEGGLIIDPGRLGNLFGIND